MSVWLVCTVKRVFLVYIPVAAMTLRLLLVAAAAAAAVAAAAVR